MRKIICGLVALAVMSVSPPAFAGALLVPSYFSPSGTPNPWTTMCDGLGGAGPTSVAILNPDSGPGKTVDPNYTSALARCHLDGQRVIGYVATRYSRQPIATVEQQVATYYSFYPGLDGIFFDNMSSVPGKKASCKKCTMTVASYYAAIYDYVHANWSSATVIANPGTPATSDWQLSTPAADAVVTFEGSAKSYVKYVPPSWVLAEPADRIANIVYAAPVSTFAVDCSTASADNAGLFYVTDRTLKPDPYAALPSYWSAETAAC